MRGAPIGGSSETHGSSTSCRRSNGKEERCGLVAFTARSRSKLKIDAWRDRALAAPEFCAEIILKREARQRYFEQLRVGRDMRAPLGGFDETGGDAARHARVLDR